MKEYTQDYLASFIDHAVLDPAMTIEELKANIMVGVNYNCKSVCVNPSAIDIAKECIANSNTKLCVVCDFPFGQSDKVSKVAQAQTIIAKGDIFEIDLVANYGLIKSHQLDIVTDEIKAVSEVCHQHGVSLKVIIESDALSNDEIKDAVACCVAGNADFVKTSTGYLKSNHVEGASPRVIELIVNEANGKIKVKGSGCVRSKERLIELIELGIDRAGVGCSSTKKILDDDE